MYMHKPGVGEWGYNLGFTNYSCTQKGIIWLFQAYQNKILLLLSFYLTDTVKMCVHALDSLFH